MTTLAPEAKLLAAFVVVLCVATTPARSPWIFALYALGLGAITVLSRVGPMPVVRRLAITIPFLLLAVTVPFVSSGAKIELIGPLAVSREGLLAGFAIAAKTLLGAWVSILVGLTTEPAEIARGMRTLKAPQTLVTIALFMLRYLEVLTGEIERQRVAMTSRGFDARWVAQARPLASGAGAVFVRSYERGERIHAAMASRGFAGVYPTPAARPASRREWMLVAIVAAAALAIAVVGRVL